MTAGSVVWESLEEDDACFLSRIEGVDRKSDLVKGVPRQRRFAPGARLRMDPCRSNGTRLFDFVDNVNRLIIVSSKLATLIKAHNISKVEYLPVTIVDYQGNVASDDYSIERANVDQQDRAWVGRR